MASIAAWAWPQAEWFFDFISPFAYLQLERLPSVFAPKDVRLRPVVLGALLNHWETKGPAEIAAKRIQTYRSAQWRAGQLGIPLRMPPAHPFNPIRLLRLAVVLDCEFYAVREIFRFVWRDGRDPACDLAWHELTTVRLACPEADALVARDDVKASLRICSDDAAARGVFGVPTLAFDGELYWGEDATDMLARSVERGSQWLREGEWGRIGQLPVGVQRKG